MRHDESVPPTPRRPKPAAAAALTVLCLGIGLSGCGGESGAQAQPGKGGDPAPSSASASAPASPATPSPASTSPAPSKKPASPAPSTPAAASGPLSGKTVVIDPGHNPDNHLHTSEINRQVDIGTTHKECDTTGTSTNSGYAEARFTLDVSHRLRTLLQAQGAKVVLTYDDDRAFGPCVDERARIGNKAGADAVVSVHADGSAVGNRGFHVILPASVRGGGADTSKIVGPSRDLGTRIAGLFVRATGSAPSNYIGGNTGLDTRKDLGGLNLSTVPKVFIECGNMRDPKDAALLTSAGWRQKAAQGIADGISSYLNG
ncbi:N-acetylmuramoyl-L-alanine amidase [Streptomyces poriferorum]|uniref:N-acetylmuramoyl-L-alanine amidase n=1 Tax=Streptomyces poriferorum TaxID=2798799 RepID=A0ABY9IV11_9ACTN|nr:MULTISPECIES: N-acetylmuramoyl-L-alanine amidase [unclassified Streptomyces]MDP5311649.1 N-acetylmuramoyl-L-alanine amidase [Streptomyces sp. Alt4]WLQ59268.1 N-acetylmuramoyl-L-alanine amidase [Streptomyces sp. Alt2]